MDFIFHLYGLLDLFLCSIRQILTELSETRFLTPENFGNFRNVHEIPRFTWSFHLTGPGWNSEIVPVDVPAMPGFSSENLEISSENHILLLPLKKGPERICTRCKACFAA